MPRADLVMSQGSGPGGDHIKSWVLEGSNIKDDNTMWIELDRQVDNNERQFTDSYVPYLYHSQRNLPLYPFHTDRDEPSG